MSPLTEQNSKAFGFRRELERLWVRAGAPSPEELARRSGKAPALFGWLEHHDALPDLEQL